MKKLMVLSLIMLMVVLAAAPFVTTCSAADKVLKIGLICNLQNSMGIELKDGVEVAAYMVNKKGGVNVGGEKYKVEFIVYDGQNNQATTLAAANRLIFQDKVKFILHDPQLIETYLPIAEKNKVITNGGTPSQATVKPGLKYSCFSGGVNNLFPVMLSWYVKNYPDKTKTYVMTGPDDANGHFSIDMFSGAFLEALGVNLIKVFYPAGQTDLSAIGTKIVSLNPTTVDCTGGGQVQDLMAMKAVWGAGYRGQYFSGGGIDTATASQYLTPEHMSYVMCSGRGIDFDPPATDVAKEIKAAWIEKHGKFEGVSFSIDEFMAIIKAVEIAGTVDDTDKIISVIYNGMKFDGMNGPAMMLARPDLGDPVNTRDSISSVLVRTFKDGKPVLFEAIPPEKGLEYVAMIPKK